MQTLRFGWRFFKCLLRCNIWYGHSEMIYHTYLKEKKKREKCFLPVLFSSPVLIHWTNLSQHYRSTQTILTSRAAGSSEFLLRPSGPNYRCNSSLDWIDLRFKYIWSESMLPWMRKGWKFCWVSGRLGRLCS